jgi:outer membrane receptor protein involved in Fe transport
MDMSSARYRIEVPFDSIVKEWKYAFFLNDSIMIDKWNITPGLRYDHTNLGGGLLSPSLGITYQASKDLLLKATVARGFHNAAPGNFVDYSSFITWFVNQDLNPEKIWSYQVGAESNIKDIIWLKLVLFRHDISDLIANDDSNGDGLTDTIENANEQRVYGGEMELKTKSFHGFVLKSGVWYEHIELLNYETDRQFDTTKSYGFNAAVSYDDRKGLRAILQGRYMWWNFPYDYWFAKYNGLILDFSLNKEVMRKKDMSLDLFFSGHNLLNGNSYDNDFYINPRRWIEAGVRWKF